MNVLKKYSFPIAFIIIILSVFWSIHSLMPHRISDLNTPETEFSTERALLILKEITREPHFVGSENHSKVRDIIVGELKKMGLEVEVQKQVAFNTKWRSGAKTENIIARIRGTGKGKALLLLSHYDSAPHSSLGASDAGSGVVTILESIRAFLSSKKQPKNDIILLISDGEELGLLGATAFVKHHKWAKDVGLVINFEARGSGGPSYMILETNKGNKKLISSFREAKTKFPVTNSLLYEIYKLMPNDTDLTVFREEENIDGYNFAFIDDHFDYHTKLDTYERLDRNTLQQQGDYLMPMLKYFSDVSLSELSSKEEHVFFNFPLFNLINYPVKWVMPMIIIAIIWFIALLIIGFVQKKLNIKQILKGVFVFGLAMKVPGLITEFGWKLILVIYPQYKDILHGFPYNGHYYLAGFLALTLGYCLWIYKRYFRKNKVVNLMVMPLISWLSINFALALLYPGVGFFIIPALIGLIIFTIMLFTDRLVNNHNILFSILLIPVFIIFVPIIQMLPVGVGLKMASISVTLTVLVFTLTMPVVSSYRGEKSMAKLFLAISLIAFAAAAFTSEYSQERKQPNSILYVLDKNKQKAYWASYNNTVDDFVHQFVGDNPTEGTFLDDITDTKYGSTFKLYSEAELVNIPESRIDILKDTVYGDLRELRLKITPQRKVHRVEIQSENVLHIRKLTVNGEQINPKDDEYFLLDTEERKHFISYFLTENDNFLDLEFSFPKDEKPDLNIFDVSYDLLSNDSIRKIKPEIKERTGLMMPAPFVLNDVVVVKNRVEF